MSDNNSGLRPALTSTPQVDHDILIMVREAMDDLRSRHEPVDADDRFDDLVQASRAAGDR